MKVIICKGLPASGKSTYAKQLVAQGNWTRVNKDDLRALLHDGKWSRENEKQVEAARDALILSALDRGSNVVVDDTNLHPKHHARIKQIVEGWYMDVLHPNRPRVTVEIKDFTSVSLDECIRRDSKRPNYVGADVIKRMYRQFLRKVETPVRIPHGETVVICDLDGTLALFGDANPYDRDFLQDRLNEAVYSVLSTTPFKVFLFSGRNGKYRKQTEEWLAHNLIRYDLLVMRDENDTRKDSIVKREFYDEHVRGKYNVAFVLDDRPQVCRLWFELGLPLLKFGDPDADF